MIECLLFVEEIKGQCPDRLEFAVVLRVVAVVIVE